MRSESTAEEASAQRRRHRRRRARRAHQSAAAARRGACRPARRLRSRSPARRRRARAGATPPRTTRTAPRSPAPTTPRSRRRATTRSIAPWPTRAQPAGRVTRLSVAVLIDNLRTTDEDGKVTETPLPAEQLERLTALVRDAVGFDADAWRQRQRREFLVPRRRRAVEEGELESIPLWERAWAQTLAKVLAGLHRVAGHRLQRAQAADQADCSTPPRPSVLRAGGAGAAAVPAAARGRRKRRALAYEQQVAAGARHGRAGSEARCAGREAWVANDE